MVVELVTSFLVEFDVYLFAIFTLNHGKRNNTSCMFKKACKTAVAFVSDSQSNEHENEFGVL